MHLWIAAAFGQSDVASFRDEFTELRVGDFGPIDPEAIEADNVCVALLGSVPVGAHCEVATRDEYHGSGFSRMRALFSLAGARRLIGGGLAN